MRRTYVLSEGAIAKVDRMAERHGIDKSTLVELMIAAYHDPEGEGALREQVGVLAARVEELAKKLEKRDE